MKTKFLFEYKIVLIMVLMMTLLSVIGVYTFNRFTDIITKLNEESRPDMRLIEVKTLITDISDAENHAKSYCLTNDSNYLQQFYSKEQIIYTRLNDIEASFKLNQGNNNILIDSLSLLINKKVGFLNQLIGIQDKFRVEVALDKVTSKIEHEVGVDSNASKKTKSSDKRFLFFKKSKKSSSKAEKDPKIELSKINTNIKEIKKEEDLYNDSLVEKERILLEQNMEITRHIRSLHNHYEKFELEKIARKTKEAKVQVDKANKQIAFFCVVIGILLLIMTIIILNYVKTNTRFRIALKKAKKEAEQLAKTKERFLANMSHEIRTPMNAIAGFSEQIAQGTLSTEQRHQMTLVQKSTDHLLYIINDILDYSKLQNGKLKLEMVSFNIYDELDDLKKLTEPMAKQNNIEITTKIEKTVPPTLKGDPFRLRQILLNILNNAIKFTNNGCIKINLSPSLVSEIGLTLRFEIEDSGVGMTQEQLSKVFFEFEQAETSTTRVYGGTGLGLTITKKLIDLFEGSINISSDLDKGTKVVIEIPFELGDEMELKELDKPKKVNRDVLKNKKILIVDDEPYNRMLLVAILKKHQITYTECENGKIAFEEIKKNNYDLILLDMRMPVWNGVETTKKIRAMNDSSKKHTPIIAISAAVTEEDKLTYFKSGMNGFLPKPFSEAELHQEIFRVLRIEYKESLELEDDNEEIPILPNDTHIDLSELKDLSAGDVLFYREMLETYITSTKEDFEKLKNAYIEKKYPKMANYAHKISSPSRHIGAQKLYQSLKKIELDCRDKKTEDLDQLYKESEIEIEQVIKEIYKEITSLEK